MLKQRENICKNVEHREHLIFFLITRKLMLSEYLGVNNIKNSEYLLNIDTSVIIIALKPQLHLLMLHLETHIRNTPQASSK